MQTCSCVQRPSWPCRRRSFASAFGRFDRLVTPIQHSLLLLPMKTRNLSQQPKSAILKHQESSETETLARMMDSRGERHKKQQLRRRLAIRCWRKNEKNHSPLFPASRRTVRICMYVHSSTLMPFLAHARARPNASPSSPLVRVRPLFFGNRSALPNFCLSGRAYRTVRTNDLPSGPGWIKKDHPMQPTDKRAVEAKF